MTVVSDQSFQTASHCHEKEIERTIALKIIQFVAALRNTYEYLWFAGNR